VTTREKAHRLLDQLSEAELEAEYERLRAAVEGERDVDEWGDLSKLHGVTSGETMRRLADEEHTAGHKPW
jgi:hypothetical protein